MSDLKKPDIFYDEALAYGRGFAQNPPFLLGLRGFTDPGQNQTGIYDDCICIVDVISFAAFNANTDPSRHKRGEAHVMAPQVCKYKIGTHNITKETIKQYQALVQAGPIKIQRESEDQNELIDVPPGWFGINIHRGGYSTPGSDGCQTIHPDQWPEFMKTIWEVFKVRKIWDINYLLIDAR